MKKHVSFRFLCVVTALLAGIQMRSQCTFTGLNPNYCFYSSTVALVSSTTGGSFSGPGVSAQGVFTPSLATPGTNTITYGICDASYSVVAGTFSPLPIAGSNTIASTAYNGIFGNDLDDGVTGALPIGFNFQFFCSNYTQFYVCTNGFISFTGGQYDYSGYPFPNTTIANAIAAPWTDIDMNFEGIVTYTTLGAAPNRKLVVTYTVCDQYDNGSDTHPMTTQIILYETTNIIEVHIITFPSCGQSATEGLIDVTGYLFAVAPGRNGSSTWSASNDMYQFIPNTQCASTQTTYVSPGSISVSGNSAPVCIGSTSTLTASGDVTYTWTSSAGTFSTPAIMVTPASNTSYSVTGTDAYNCNATSVITITVNTTPTVTPASSPASGSICLGGTVALSGSGVNTYTWASPGVTTNVAFSPTATTTYTLGGTNACGIASANITITVTPLPVSAVASSTLICAGTAATLSAGGANTYTWTTATSTVFSGNFIVSPASLTTYTLQGKIGACTGNTIISVNTKPIPTLNVSVSNTAICNGGSANLSVSGTASTYTWNPGGQPGATASVSPTLTTLFTVTGTNSVNCTGSASQVILVYQNPTVSATTSDPEVCTNGTVALTASGANTYTWSNNSNSTVTIVNLASSTIYSVTGTDANNCSSTAAVSVSVFQPTVGVSSGTAVCTGFNAVISANGAGFYSWSNGASGQAITVNPTLTTVYTVTGSVTDQNSNVVCDATNTVQVTVNNNPVITAAANHTIICLNNSAVLTADGAGANGTYTWTGGSGAVQSVSTSVSPIASQNYSVTGVDGNGCKGTAVVQVQVSPCTGISIIAANATSLVIYPNPSNGEFTISSDQAITLHILNELGQSVKTLTLTSANSEVQVSGLANGIYFIMGKNENGSVKEKLVIAK